MPSKDASKIPVGKLTVKEAEREHSRLEGEIKQHDKRYYQKDAPTVSDAEYDALRRRYEAIEARFPELRTFESLSLRVGAAPSARFAKVRHAVPMLSLDNAFARRGRRRFRRPHPPLPATCRTTSEIVFTAEPKIDGLSMSLRYEGGAARHGATRGDGSEGEDVTANIEDAEGHPAPAQGQAACRRYARCAAKST